MALPKRSNIHLPLLKVLSDSRGSLSTQEALTKVKQYYPNLIPEDLAAQNKSGGNSLNNRIRWAKQDLVLRGEIDNSSIGVWRINEKGKAHLSNDWKTWKAEYSEDFEAEGPRMHNASKGDMDNLLDYDSLEFGLREVNTRVEDEMLVRLRSVEPAVFEQIIGQLLEKYDYGTTEDGTAKVTGRAGDGGIDGECAIDRLGVLKAKFQAKRYGADKLITGETVRAFVGALATERASYGYLSQLLTLLKERRRHHRSQAMLSSLVGRNWLG